MVHVTYTHIYTILYSMVHVTYTHIYILHGACYIHTYIHYIIPVYRVSCNNDHCPPDGVVVGLTSLDHLHQNLDACLEGPLDQRECIHTPHHLMCVRRYSVLGCAGVVSAFDAAWLLDKPHSVTYYR